MTRTPAITLINPQMGENIGACARAMLNCGLSDLRIVNPRDGWPSEAAQAMSSGALDKMPPVKVFDDTASALTDCHYVYATTARPRDMVKPVFTAKSAAQDMLSRQQGKQKIGLLFGAERSGLSNDDVAQAHAIITVPLNPDFSSLNLAQGVLLTAYEWFHLQAQTPDQVMPTGDSIPATHHELNGLLMRLEDELQTHGFFKSADMKPTIARNLKNMFSRAEMTEQEVRTFHGIISALINQNTKV